MPAGTLKEEPLQLGQGGRLFAILCEPVQRNADRPVFVFLSAGLLHRVGPSRLHVTLARQLAELGFASLRVDLAGKGDSPGRGSMTNQETVALDFEDIRGALKARYGEFSMVLAGLCSGADNAIRLCIKEPRVEGLLLLDPICFRDAGFQRRAWAGKWLNPRRYLRTLKRWLRRDARTEAPGTDAPGSALMLRDLPSIEQLRGAFECIRERGGSVLSVFTHYALSYYNSPGQLRSVLEMSDYPKFCTEIFWPEVEHTYKFELHRERLQKAVLAWARGFA